jgi:hypothetical protein
MAAAERTPVRPLRNLIRNRLLAAAEENGYPKEVAEEALRSMESDRPLLDWLLNGGLAQLITTFLELLALFKK